MNNLDFYRDTITFVAWCNKFGLDYTSNVYLEQRLADLSLSFGIGVAEALAAPMGTTRKIRAWEKAHIAAVGVMATLSVMADIAMGKGSLSSKDIVEDLTTKIEEISSLIRDIKKFEGRVEFSELPPYESLGAPWGHQPE